MTDAIELESEYALTLLYREDITADTERWKEMRTWLEAQGWRATWRKTRIPVARARYQLDIEPVPGAKVDEVVARLEPVEFSAIEFL